MKRRILFLLLIGLSIGFGSLWAQENEEILLEPDSVAVMAPKLDKPIITVAEDAPNDRGEVINLSWEYKKAQKTPSYIEVLRSENPNRDFTIIIRVHPSTKSFTDASVEPEKEYYYKLESYISDEFGERKVASEVVGPVVPKGNWFNFGRLNILICTIIFFAIIFWYTYHASKGKDFFIRKIAGLAAIGEAVGRSTEMGKPVLYVSGIGVISDVQTLASLVILGEVAKITAQYDTPLLVPVWDPVLMSAAEEIVRESHMDVGRPDSFNPDNIRYITSEQFAYAAGVNGIMLREKPAAIVYMGVFYAESLILAETGFLAGAIQVAGTMMVSQIPFFIAACDYCLIGEELFAASAYLSREPRLLSNLKSSDIGKFVFVILTLIGVITVTLGKSWFINWFITQ